MTDGRDPIETWLSRDVELLPPPPGAFRQVRRRAVRRRAVRTASAAAGAAVIVAAAAGLPQLAGSLLPNSGGPNRYVTGSSSPGSRTSHSTPGPSVTAPGPSRGPALSAAGTGPSPPPGLRPTSVTFVGNGSGILGAVIGPGGSSCGPGPCTVIAGTADYGRHWSRVGGPRADPPAGSSGVSQVRFADPLHGWAFGPALWRTADSGRSWSAEHHLHGRVIDLSTVGGRVLAVAGIGCTGSGSGSGYASGCTGFALYSAAADGGRWRQVLTDKGVQVVPGSLQLTSGHGYLMAAGRLYSGPLAGSAWTAVPTASPSTPACLTNPAGRGPWLIAPSLPSSPGSGAVFLVCGTARGAAGAGLALYASADGGVNWQPRGTVPAAGTATSLAVSPGGRLVLATSAGIYYHSPGARTWRSATLRGTAGHVGFTFVGMTTDSNGVAVPNPAARDIFITHDGGRTWRPVTP